MPEDLDGSWLSSAPVQPVLRPAFVCDSRWNSARGLAL